MTTAKILGGKILRKAGDNAPAILTSVGVVGVISTAVLAVRATPFALFLINEEVGRREDIANSSDLEPEFDHLTKFEIVKVAWRPYLPVGLVALGSIAAIVGANTVSTKRQAALGSALALSQRAYREYKEQTLKQVGSKTEEVIRGEVAKERWEKEGIGNKEVIIIGSGKTLCYDVFSGRSFLSDLNTLEKAEIAVNHTIINSNYATLNDFWREVGLPTTSPAEQIGWNNDNLCRIAIAAMQVEDGQPALSVDFHVPPVSRPDKVW